MKIETLELRGLPGGIKSYMQDKVVSDYILRYKDKDPILDAPAASMVFAESCRFQGLTIRNYKSTTAAITLHSVWNATLRDIKLMQCKTPAGLAITSDKAEDNADPRTNDVALDQLQIEATAGPAVTVDNAVLVNVYGGKYHGSDFNSRRPTDYTGPLWRIHNSIVIFHGPVLAKCDHPPIEITGRRSRVLGTCYCQSGTPTAVLTEHPAAVKHLQLIPIRDKAPMMKEEVEDDTLGR